MRRTVLNYRTPEPRPKVPREVYWRTLAGASFLLACAVGTTATLGRALVMVNATAFISEREQRFILQFAVGILIFAIFAAWFTAAVLAIVALVDRDGPPRLALYALAVSGGTVAVQIAIALLAS